MAMTESQERALVERARRDPDAFAFLYDPYFPRIYAYVRHRVGTRQDAEDLVSEVFLHAVAALDRFTWRHEASFASWLFRIAHNRLANFYRQQGRAATLPLELATQQPAPDLTPDEFILRDEAGAALHAHLATLAPRRREVVALRFFGDLRNREIAAVLGLDERTVAAHLSRGLLDLQRRPPCPPYAILPPASNDTEKGLARLAVLAYGGPLKDGDRRVAQLTRRPEQVIQPLPDSVQRRPPLGVPLRVAIDAALIALGFWLAYQLRYEFGFPDDVSRDTVINSVFFPGDYRPFRLFIPVFLLLEAILLLIFAARGVYRQPRWTGFLDEALLVGSSALLGFSVLIVAVFYYQRLAFSRAIYLYGLVIIVGLLLLWRLVWRGTVTWMRARGRWTERVLVVGAGPAGERVMSALLGQPGLGYTLAGFVDDAPVAPDWAIATQRAVMRPERLGAIHDLPETIRNAAIDEVIIALPSGAHDQLYWAIEQCRHGRVAFTLVPDLFELSLDRVSIHALNGLPLISTQDSGLRGPNAGIKRAFDLLVGGGGLFLVGLPMLIIAALIRLDSRGPALYGQRRVGRNGRHFTCYKFRSMYTGAHDDYAKLASSADYTGDRVAFKMKDDPRVTRIGKLLRRTSLDELPNLLNVLRGDMSLVGPRPHVPEEVAKYDPWHRQRLTLVPGLTCLWQVNGRSDLTFDEQVRFDLYYAESWSIWLDIKILLWTIPAVVTRRGAY